MSVPSSIAPAQPPLTVDTDSLRSWLLDTGIHPLTYALGKSRLHNSTCVIPEQRLKSLYEAARCVGKLYDELCAIVIRDSSHLKEFFSLTPLQEALWNLSGGTWKGLARADVFCTQDGDVMVAEVNSDTPSGMDEAFLLGRFISPRQGDWIDPNKSLPEAFRTVIDHEYAKLGTHSPSPAVGIVYPTDIPEDMGLLQIYQWWLERFGYRVVLGSPWNLSLDAEGHVTLFGTRVDLLLRHYKTDWWCEERSVWKNVLPRDDVPSLLRILNELAAPLAERRLSLVNPFGTILTQNKLSLAFFHETFHLFSPEAREWIHRYVPYSQRLSGFDRASLIAEKDDWVLKSDYGCEGAEVLIGREADQNEWIQWIDLAVPEHWIAQRYFEAERDEEGRIENHGVYLAGGEPCGIYMRIDGKSTGLTSAIAPVLVRPTLGIAPQQRDVTGPAVPPLDEEVASLLSAYTPTERWLPFRMPLILSSAVDPSRPVLFAPTDGTDQVREFASRLSSLLLEADRALSGSLLIVSDLDGVESAMVCAELSCAADVVLQVENIAHEREVVPLSKTLGALIHVAPTIGEEHRIHSAERTSPAVILLDRQRLRTIADESSRFNNRHWAYLPTIEALRERGIERLLYLCPTDEDLESDDLNEDFVACSTAGIRVSYVGVYTAPKAGTLHSLLATHERQPLRRHTLFSTPQTDQLP